MGGHRCLGHKVYHKTKYSSSYEICGSQESDYEDYYLLGSGDSTTV
jgi:hypothetical protein